MAVQSGQPTTAREILVNNDPELAELQQAVKLQPQQMQQFIHQDTQQAQQWIWWESP